MQKAVNIPTSGKQLKGLLTTPAEALGIILFSHGSGSGRLSPRNQFVADVLQQARFSTLLADLLTEKEDETYQTRFDIELLTERLTDIARWLQQQKDTQYLPIGLFGASTGAAAALKCCVKKELDIKAVVSRGGRPDLAIPILSKVTAPTLLIVGGNDTEVIQLNQQAYSVMKCTKKLDIIPGATHLFEEPGALEKVANLAQQWFSTYLKTQ